MNMFLIDFIRAIQNGSQTALLALIFIVIIGVYVVLMFLNRPQSR